MISSGGRRLPLSVPLPNLSNYLFDKTCMCKFYLTAPTAACSHVRLQGGTFPYHWTPP